MSQLISNAAGGQGTAFDAKIPELSDTANIVEAFKLYHYGLDNYNGETAPAEQSIFSHIKGLDERIDDLELVPDVVINGTLDEIEVSSIDSTTFTLGLPDNISVSGSVNIGGDIVVGQDALFQNDLTILGDFTVSGSTTFINTQNLQVTDPLIYLATEQYDTDIFDVGFTAAYGTEGMDEIDHLHRGLAYDVTDSKWKLFSNAPHPVDNYIDYTTANFDTLKLGTLESTTISNSGTITTDSLIVTGDFDHRINLTSQTGNYIIGLGDVGEVVQMNVGSANTLTVPADGTTNFPIGSQLVVLQINSGQTTITPAGGVTINGTPGLKLRAQWSSATLVKRAANTWVAIGDLVA